MTNSNPFGTGNGSGTGLFDLIEGVVGYAGRNIPGYTDPEAEGPKYRRADQIGIGAEVVTPEGKTVFVESASRVSDDGLIEFVFSDTDVLTVWPNIQFEVK